MFEDDIQEMVNRFLQHAPHGIYTNAERAEYLLSKTPIQHRIQPVNVETIMPFVLESERQRLTRVHEIFCKLTDEYWGK